MRERGVRESVDKGRGGKYREAAEAAQETGWSSDSPTLYMASPTPEERKIDEGSRDGALRRAAGAMISE
jgi:hypothetical protein